MTLLVFMGLSPVMAEDEASNTDNDSNFLEINFGLTTFESRYTDAPENIGVFFLIHLNYQWKGFFIENKGNKSLGMPGGGYHFYNQKNWVLDAYISETHHGILEEYTENLNSEHNGLQGLSVRGPDVRLGLRVTHYIDNSTAMRLLLAPIGNRGPYVGAWYGKTWQVQNYNFHAIASAQYHAAETQNYYYGVRGAEVSDKFPAYQARSGITLGAELGLTYPLTKDWVFESSLKLTRLPNSVYHSPLVESRVETIAQISLVYVLF
ncbi:MipA/OmpV family protein [Paraglaciecola sp.]|uniref:MipA/OmpV family protein n=1 Tax=Paraglaciecola sp. TaxID=1920173 RepID=UPI0030F445CC